ncbi:hypothetical protein ACWGQ5_45665 [Streptomyces sp. NPDC055722]
MTDRDVSARHTSVAVRVRTDGEVDEEALAYIRSKVDAVLARPGLEAASGRVTITKDTAHHVLLPWAAGAEIRVGGHLIVVHAREAGPDRLEDRLRSQLDQALHRAGTARREAAPPPWRGGGSDDGTASGNV